jgi:thymidylate kinase
MRVKADSSKLRTRRSACVGARDGTSSELTEYKLTSRAASILGRTIKIVPVYVWDKLIMADKKDRLVSGSEEPVLRKVIEHRGIKLRRPQEKNSYLLERIVLDSRVLIIEGISGSGKDTFQTYLKKKLKDRDVYDYSEGELLQSWNQLQIGGIFKLRIKFMKLFVNYVKHIVNRDENAVFLLNRFHLSAYVMTVIQQPKLEREYDEIIHILRTLPVHVFILQLAENEIEKRSLHPERSGAWQKVQQQIVKKEGFRDRLERYIWQQGLILEAAERQQIPYSVIKVPTAPEIGGAWVSAPEAQNIDRRSGRMNAADVKPPRRKRDLPQTF